MPHGCGCPVPRTFLTLGTTQYLKTNEGDQHPAQLFNMLSDPNENTNIVKQEPGTVTRLDAQRSFWDTNFALEDNFGSHAGSSERVCDPIAYLSGNPFSGRVHHEPLPHTLE
jgi:hypothetical protein